MTDTKERKHNDKNDRRLNPAVLAALVITALILIVFLLAKAMKKPAPKKQLPPADILSSVSESIPDAQADTEKLSQNFTYDQIERTAECELLYVGQEGAQLSKNSLQPVYNAVFDKSGLQIASLKSAGLRCRSEMIIPLNSMLCDFYDETGLRTVMIEKAFEENDTDSLSDNEYDEQEDSSVSDGGFYDQFGNYITFGYTDEYGNYYGDGYYDSYGNYMGYGYYDDQGNYISYEDAANALPQDSEYETENEAEEQPTCSEHSNGYSIDLSLYFKETDKTGDFDGTGDYAWFSENCYKYGFILRYPQGKEEITGMLENTAHFRYVGKTAAKIMHDNGLALEELAAFMQEYNYDHPLTVNTIDGTAIFYSIQDPGGEGVNIQIPEDSEGTALDYTASDTGSGSYLITVMLTEEFIADTAEQADTDTSSASESLKNTGGNLNE